ncbi:MAG: hypothetical protein MI976_00785 [Pseudomonadales bacterium]|nr:hypothetical protein [Pseudomonadales bacterium]
MKKFNFAAVLIGLSLSGVVSAGDMETKKDTAEVKEVNQFKSLDTDSDGYISGTEATASQPVSASFGKLDADTDGRLSAEEFSKYEVKGNW